MVVFVRGKIFLWDIFFFIFKVIVVLDVYEIIYFVFDVLFFNL